MRKFVSVLLLASAALYVAYVIRLDAGDGVDWHTVLAEANIHAVELAENEHQRRLLADEMDRILARLEHGTITFTDAVQAIENEAACTYPDFLSYLQWLETGETMKEKLGRNIVRHFQARHRHLKTSEAFHILERCEKDLRAMLNGTENSIVH